ncbi:MAG: SdrD B-like domain-containing protein, partial [Syntrophomonadaceae bacterium]
MKRLHVFFMLFTACFLVISGVVQAQSMGWHKAIGNLVWNDLNKNGVQDLGEPGLPDIEVSLYKCGELPTTGLTTNSIPNGAELVAKTRTDVNGNYAFGGLCPAKYFVAIAVPDGWAVSPVFQGTSDEKDSDIFPYLDHSGFVCIFESTTELLSVDAGLFKIQDCDLVNIGDMVFNDCNHNGVQDCDEVGIAGVCLNIYACDIIPMDGHDYLSADRRHCKGLKVGETVTDLNGHYQFSDLLPGEYCIEIALPHGFRTVPRPNCPDVCNPDYETNMTGCMMFNACTKNMDIDFAICNKEDNCKLASVGDLVWNDVDKDGIQEKNEPVMPNITLTLYTCGDNISGVNAFSRRDCIECASMKVGTTKTDANGNYLFKNLIP